MSTHTLGTGMPGPDQLALDFTAEDVDIVDTPEAEGADDTVDDAPVDADADTDAEDLADVPEAVNYKDRNADMRERYIAAERALQSATDAGDTQSAAQAQGELDAIGHEFYSLNKGLALGMARRFTTGHDSDPDYASAANLGLWEAFLRWDPSMGTTFGGFSRQYIKGRIQRTVRSVEFAHLSQSEFNLRRDIRNNQGKLVGVLGRTPTFQEIADATGCTVDKVERALKNPNTSMDTPLGDGAGTFADIVADKLARTSPGSGAGLDGLDGDLDELSDLELWVASARSDLLGGDTPSLVEVADMVGIGREVARRAETRAWTRLAVSRFAGEFGALPSDIQLAAYSGKDLDHVVKFRQSAFEDLKSRYGRIRTAIREASTAQARNIAAARLDRFGEEFLAATADLASELGARHVEDDEPLGSATAAWAIFSAFLAWDPACGTTFPTSARKAVAATYGRARTIEPGSPGEPVDIDVTWTWIRRQVLTPA